MEDKKLIKKIKEWLWLDSHNEEECQEVRMNSKMLLNFIEEWEQGGKENT